MNSTSSSAAGVPGLFRFWQAGPGHDRNFPTGRAVMNAIDDSISISRKMSLIPRPVFVNPVFN